MASSHPAKDPVQTLPSKDSYPVYIPAKNHFKIHFFAGPSRQEVVFVVFAVLKTTI